MPQTRQCFPTQSSGTLRQWGKCSVWKGAKCGVSGGLGNPEIRNRYGNSVQFPVLPLSITFLPLLWKMLYGLYYTVSETQSHSLSASKKQHTLCCEKQVMIRFWVFCGFEFFFWEFRSYGPLIYHMKQFSFTRFRWRIGTPGELIFSRIWRLLRLYRIVRLRNVPLFILHVSKLDQETSR